MSLSVSGQTTTLIPAIVDPAQQSAAAAAAADAAAKATTKASSSGTGNAGSGDQVTLSAQAQQLLSTDAAAAPKPPRGALVFDAQGATVGGKRVALIDIINSTDNTYTETERAAATLQINQRETAGFRWAKPTKQDPVALKQYYATYLSYLQKLSPEEQKSSRYAGQIDNAKQLVKQADIQIAKSSIQQVNVSTYASGSSGLFGPLISGINARVTRQLAGLPNTNLTSTARLFQQAISHPRTAEQVLASVGLNGSTGSSSGGKPGTGTSSGAGGSGSGSSGGGPASPI